jgi:hypothetical protein
MKACGNGPSMQIAFTLPMLNFRPKVNQNAVHRTAEQPTFFPARLKLHRERGSRLAPFDPSATSPSNNDPHAARAMPRAGFGDHAKAKGNDPSPWGELRPSRGTARDAGPRRSATADHI